MIIIDAEKTYEQKTNQIHYTNTWSRYLPLLIMQSCHTVFVKNCDMSENYYNSKVACKNYFGHH